MPLAIVDPPYGIKESAHRSISRVKKAKTKNYRKELWDQAPPPAEYFAELMRVSQNQIIWGGNYFLDHLPSTRCMLVWDKVNDNTDFADCELAWTSFNTSVRIFRYMWNGMMQGNTLDGRIMQGNKALNQQRIHPTEKPVHLYKWIMKNYAKKGDVILDTHGGSMSIAHAALEMGFDLDVCEIDPFYFNPAVARFETFKDQYERQYQLNFNG
jgi:site-specific DNA-methyltransferase (adenine-specific)